jgi:hypothetical protein
VLAAELHRLLVTARGGRVKKLLRDAVDHLTNGDIRWAIRCVEKPLKLLDGACQQRALKILLLLYGRAFAASHGRVERGTRLGEAARNWFSALTIGEQYAVFRDHYSDLRSLEKHFSARDVIEFMQFLGRGNPAGRDLELIRHFCRESSGLMTPGELTHVASHIVKYDRPLANDVRRQSVKAELRSSRREPGWYRDTKSTLAELAEDLPPAEFDAFLCECLDEARRGPPSAAAATVYLALGRRRETSRPDEALTLYWEGLRRAAVDSRGRSVETFCDRLIGVMPKQRRGELLAWVLEQKRRVCEEGVDPSIIYGLPNAAESLLRGRKLLDFSLDLASGLLARGCEHESSWVLTRAVNRVARTGKKRAAELLGEWWPKFGLAQRPDLMERQAELLADVEPERSIELHLLLFELYQSEEYREYLRDDYGDDDSSYQVERSLERAMALVQDSDPSGAFERLAGILQEPPSIGVEKVSGGFLLL